MLYGIFTVFDRATRCFGRPFFSQTQDSAKRAFSDEVNRASPENQMWQHPGDFELYDLGGFDDATASVEAHAQPVFLVNGSHVQRRAVEKGSE